MSDDPSPYQAPSLQVCVPVCLSRSLCLCLSVCLFLSLSFHPHFFPRANRVFLQCVGGREYRKQPQNRELQVYILSYQPFQKKALPSLSLYIKPQGRTLSGWDTYSSKAGPSDCLLNGHFPLLPHKHNSDPITVPGALGGELFHSPKREVILDLYQSWYLDSPASY